MPVYVGSVRLVQMRLLVFNDEMPRPNNYASAIERGNNAMRHDVFHRGVALAMLEPALFGGMHHGARHGVGKVFLQAGGKAQNFILGSGVAHRFDAHQLGRRLGERARFVEYDGVRLGECLEVTRPFHHNACLCRIAHGGHHGN